MLHTTDTHELFHRFSDHHAYIFVFDFWHSLELFQITFGHSFAYRAEWLIIHIQFNMLLHVLSACMIFCMCVVAHSICVCSFIFMYYIVPCRAFLTLVNDTAEVMEVSFYFSIATLDFNSLSRNRQGTTFHAVPSLAMWHS